MEDLLDCKDLYDPIEGDNVSSSDMSDADWKKLQKKTSGVIRQWVDISLYNHVAKETNPHTLWKNLENIYIYIYIYIYMRQRTHKQRFS